MSAGFLVWEILEMQYGISVLKRRVGCVIIRYLDYSFLCSFKNKKYNIIDYGF